MKTTDKVFVASHIPPSLYRELQRIAEKEDRSISYVIASFCTEGVNTRIESAK